jgi:hypothetical protein
MSEQRSTHTSGHGGQDDGAAPKRGRGIPPLVWIVLALLVAWLVIALMQRQGSDRTPQGGSHPAQAEGTSVMPATPPSGTTPGTPAGVINGPNQPPAQ